MSHFVTLVNFYMSEQEENCEENSYYAAEIARIKEKLEKEPENLVLQVTLRYLQNKGSTLERSAEHEISELMAPYCEQTNDPKYLEFDDRTDALRREYETDTTNCVRLPNGVIVSMYDQTVTGKYRIKDGKVYQRKAGRLGHEKRTKKAKKMRALPEYPVKKLYPTLEQYAEEHCGCTFDRQYNAYGYYCNPNAFWDWYSVGGRWPFQFLVRDTAEYILGERSYGDEDTTCEAPEGYIWACGARKKDIAWDLMKEWEMQHERKRFELLAEAFRSGKVPEESFWRITEDGIFSFLTQIYFKGESEEAYLRRNGLAADQRMIPGAYSFLRDGKWISKGNMGWWGISTDDKSEEVWRQMLADYLDSIPDDHFLVGVDCHI